MATTETNLRMNELEAVNSMLSAIGELPVNELEEGTVTLAAVARNVLHRESRTLQSQGLNCNTEYSYSLLPDEDGNIYVPSNTLNVDPDDPEQDYVIRGTRLYNKLDHTYVFATTVKVTLILFIPFDDLPNHVQVYITERARRKFQKDFVGSSTLDSMAQADEAKARIMFKKIEERNKDANMLSSSAVGRSLRYRRRY